MGTASQFDKILKDELNIHAAWLPITNTFKLGDFGLISDGVLVKMGSIEDDFGVSVDGDPGPPTTLNFTSKGTRVLRLTGGAEVQAFPDNNIDAKLTVEFGSSSSFLAKATLSVFQMRNLLAIANKLADTPNWDGRYAVVSSVYRGDDCAIISSKSANSKIELSGKANALKQFDIGSAAVGIEVSSKVDIGLDLVGKSGVIGLSLFKLSWWSGGAKVLSGGNVQIEQSTDSGWPTSLTNDV